MWHGGAWILWTPMGWKNTTNIEGNVAGTIAGNAAREGVWQPGLGGKMPPILEAVLQMNLSEIW